MWTGFLNAAKDFVYWFVTWAASWPLALLDAVWALIPETTQAQLQPLVEVLIVANHWLPIEETIVAVTALFELELSLFVIKLVLKRFLRW